MQRGHYGAKIPKGCTQHVTVRTRICWSAARSSPLRLPTPRCGATGTANLVLDDGGAARSTGTSSTPLIGRSRALVDLLETGQPTAGHGNEMEATGHRRKVSDHIERFVPLVVLHDKDRIMCEGQRQPWSFRSLWYWVRAVAVGGLPACRDGRGVASPEGPPRPDPAANSHSHDGPADVSDATTRPGSGTARRLRTLLRQHRRP